jgi:hypothetical protein
LLFCKCVSTPSAQKIACEAGKTRENIACRDGKPVEGAMVEGTWSGGTNGGDSCTTGEDRSCSLTKSNLKSDIASVLFTVTNVTHPAYSYVPEDNHETGITIYSPY